MIGTQNTPPEPKYDDTFSKDLLRRYLSQLVRQGYLVDALNDDYSGSVDYEVAFHAYETSCHRLKEPLFVLSLLENKYDLLMQLAYDKVERSDTDYTRSKSQELVDEWQRLYKTLAGRELDDEVMEECLPERYARLSHHAKSWKFRNAMMDWERKYGFLRPLPEMTEEERKRVTQRRNANAALRLSNVNRRKQRGFRDGE